jgi:hypothetical protein
MTESVHIEKKTSWWRSIPRAVWELETSLRTEQLVDSRKIDRFSQT